MDLAPRINDGVVDNIKPKQKKVAFNLTTGTQALKAIENAIEHTSSKWSNFMKNKPWAPKPKCEFTPLGEP